MKFVKVTFNLEQINRHTRMLKTQNGEAQLQIKDNLLKM